MFVIKREKEKFEVTHGASRDVLSGCSSRADILDRGWVVDTVILISHYDETFL